MIKKTIIEPYVLEIYALAICFVALTCFIVSLAIGAYSLCSMIKPDFTLSPQIYSQHQTNDRYWAAMERSAYDFKLKERPEEAQLTQERQIAFTQALEAERHEGWQVLIKTLITMFISAVIFAVHWRLANRMRSLLNPEIYGLHSSLPQTTSIIR